MAVGERVVCRRNDRTVDVDNGMRGTVRHLDQHRLVIETDAGLVRELPAAYVAEHLEHAYALTAHGMQGGTLERAVVLASPRELTAGWSYTALSRARGETRLLIYDRQPAEGRDEYAPTEHAPTAAQATLLARVQRHMLERDDEELAIEQLPAADRRADDRELAGALALPDAPLQERAAARAEPTLPPASANRLRGLRERVEQLSAQLQALPTRDLRRIDDLDARALNLGTQRERLAANLAQLPAPTRGHFAGEQDPHAIARARLTSAFEAHERELAAVLAQRAELERELGNGADMRAERDGLEHAVSEATREHRELRKELVEREVQDPSSGVRASFGEGPNGSRPREVWENAVRQAAHYRLDHDVIDPGSALGPRPEHREGQREWERASRAIARDARRLGRDIDIERDVDLGIEF